MEHIRIVANGHETTLTDDFAMDLELVNPLFNDNVQSGSLPFNIPLEGNRFLVKNAEDANSDVKVMDVEHTPCVVYVDDVPYHSGEIIVSEDQELKDTLDASINSYVRSLDDLIQDLECQDVPVKDKIQIGECVGDVTPDFTFHITTKITYEFHQLWQYPDHYEVTTTPQTKEWEEYDLTEDGDMDSYCGGEIDLPVVGFSVPHVYKERSGGHIVTVKNADGTPQIEKNLINTNRAYGEPDADGTPAYYCNARICYANYNINTEGTTSDEVNLKEPFRVLEAERPGSGVCFYVLYFLDCLFGKDCLNLSYDNSKLLTVEDMKRLAFFTTHCEYDTERKYPNASGYDLTTYAQINQWLAQRVDNINIKTAQIDGLTPTFDWKDVKSLRVRPTRAGEEMDMYNPEPTGALFDNSTYPATIKEEGTVFVGDVIPVYEKIVMVGEVQPGIVVNRYANLPVKVTGIQTQMLENPTGNIKANIMKMYANSKNFPEKSVSDIIDSLWASFGIKFVLDNEKHSVTPYYIRDVLRDSEAPRVLRGKVLSITKKVEKVTGFRMRYAAESDPKDQSKNVSDGVRDYETAFDYLMSASDIDYTLNYDQIKPLESVSNVTCYIDVNTGNAYRFKVDKDTKKDVAMFEVAGYKGISKGDCSKKNEDYIVDITSKFEPVIFTDTDYDFGNKDTIMTAFVDEKMRNPQEHFELTFALGTSMVDFPVKATVNTNESYDPSDTENGDSPLQSYDWGNSVAVMRGGGTAESGASIQYYDYNYDGFNNAKYRTVSGAYAMTSDSLDNYGNEYDYNASASGIGDGERFSLKITGYKHDEEGNPLTDGQGNILCADDVVDSQGNIVTKIRSRGLFDTFMSEYAHFVLERKKLVIRMKCEVAELVDIPNYWDKKWQVGDIVGWINQIKTHVTKEAGLEEVEVEMYCL